MPEATPNSAAEIQWQRLETYRQRYQISERLGPLESLEKSMERRRARLNGLVKRKSELQDQLAAVATEIHVVDEEIQRSLMTGALLINEIIEQVRVDEGEAWSPFLVRGFRVWRIVDGQVLGNQMHWPTPTLSSSCLRQIPGDDIPHAGWRCGPPACGIYAVKELDWFPAEVAGCRMDRSVVGVVGMSGKVVEHEMGYRGHTASVLAISARLGSYWLLTGNPAEIEAVFDDPDAAIPEFGVHRRPEPEEARRFLESNKENEEQWI